MSNYKILIDSSMWIEYFKNGNIPFIDKLLEDGFACINDVILMELQLVINIENDLIF